MNTIKTITIATDFSKHSRTTYNYGRALAQAIGAKVQLIHIYLGPVNPATPFYKAIMPTLEHLHQSETKKLIKWAKDPEVECVAYSGDAAFELVELTKHNTFDLLVVGNKGKTDLMGTFVGSVSRMVVHEAHCPVLMIPGKVKYNGIKEILFTYSDESAKSEYIQYANDLAKTLGAAIHFVYVNQDGMSKAPDSAKLLGLVETPYSVKELHFPSVSGALELHLKDHAAQLIVAATHHYNFWESIAHMSVTGALTWNDKLPILALHKEDLRFEV